MICIHFSKLPTGLYLYVSLPCSQFNYLYPFQQAADWPILVCIPSLLTVQWSASFSASCRLAYTCMYPFPAHSSIICILFSKLLTGLYLYVSLPCSQLNDLYPFQQAVDCICICICKSTLQDPKLE